MRKIFSILMIGIIMIPNLTKVGILINFEINQSFIAEVLCVNKSKPMTKCNGQCFLAKQLKKAEEQNDTKVPLIKMEKLEMAFFSSDTPLDFQSITEQYVARLNPAKGIEFYTSSFVADIFHPPLFKFTLHFDRV
ncbi:hypothetical protein M8998_10995 [Sphingobacterium sp. lm-10]|uniref:hypothetical protein n=1 Tax=Sphingobacterium sp. lm-10 TaxID=2944904 RepID=UPI00202114C8|nr:hypothetical protein [Sphingobacterium sp. lm-10]MCL7988466.1 hypothetical protein [Sphingobacterium sp. lm-10]